MGAFSVAMGLTVYRGGNYRPEGREELQMIKIRVPRKLSPQSCTDAQRHGRRPLSQYREPLCEWAQSCRNTIFLWRKT